MSSRVILLRLIHVVVGKGEDGHQQQQGSGAVDPWFGGHHASAISEWAPRGPCLDQPRSSSRTDRMPTRTNNTSCRSCRSVMVSDWIATSSHAASMISALVLEAVTLEVVIFGMWVGGLSAVP